MNDGGHRICIGLCERNSRDIVGVVAKKPAFLVRQLPIRRKGFLTGTCIGAHFFAEIHNRPSFQNDANGLEGIKNGNIIFIGIR